MKIFVFWQMSPRFLLPALAVFFCVIQVVKSVTKTSLKKIKIGAMFMPIDKNGETNVGRQAQMLAAFLMAIKEINARSDILPSYELKVALVSPDSDDYVGGVSAAVKLNNEVTFSGTATDYFSNSLVGVDAVVGGLGNQATIGSNMYFSGSTVKLLQISSFADATELGIGTDFPYKVQTTAIASFEGMVLQNFLCTYFKYSRVRYA